MLYVLDLIGVIVFAISGAIVARDRQFDMFGGVVLAIVTAIGGGTFRDLILGRTPVFWLNDPFYCTLATMTALLFLLLFRVYRFNQHWRNTLAVADAAGLAVFTILGVSIALEHHIHPAMAVMLGTISGCFGGVIRDVLANRAPLIFQREIYATASLVGGGSFLVCRYFSVPQETTILAAAGITFSLRVSAIYFGWHLPTYKNK